MYYVYVLLSLKDKMLYTGYSNDLNKRFLEHNQGLVESTKDRRPLELVYYECSLSKEDAIRRERCLKSGKGKRYIKSRISSYMACRDSESGLAPNQIFAGYS
ncbi:MAG: GIY-YIG nuclease family protein [Candidatus Omnitrophica bacterium]|nr:GIY-YIG nuclease family protein [Candidatus Omnitrophota bacterium]